MNDAERGHLDAVDWDAMVRESKGDLPNLPDHELLRQWREGKRRYQRRKELWTRSALFVLAVAAFIGLVMVWSCAPAQAQAQCAPHDAMLGSLESRYQEHVVAKGVSTDGNVMEITASEGGSWTMVLSNPNTGIACLFAAGEGWRIVPPQEPGRPT